MGTAPVHAATRVPSVNVMVPELYFIFRHSQLQQLIIASDTVFPARQQYGYKVIFFQREKFRQKYPLHVIRICSAWNPGLYHMPGSVYRFVRNSINYRSIFGTVCILYESGIKQAQLSFHLPPTFPYRYHSRNCNHIRPGMNRRASSLPRNAGNMPGIRPLLHSKAWWSEYRSLSTTPPHNRPPEELHASGALPLLSCKPPWHPGAGRRHVSLSDISSGISDKTAYTAPLFPPLSSFFFPDIFIKEKLALRPNAAEMTIATDSPET